MRKQFIFSVVFIFLLSATGLQAQKHDRKLQIDTDTIVSTDTVEYELIVIDPGFESFLATQKPASFFSQDYYETWNYRYVTEWNLRHSDPMVYGDLYETRIDYDPHTDYGLELNYRLYYYFRFFEEKNQVHLVPGRQ